MPGHPNGWWRSGRAAGSGGGSTALVEWGPDFGGTDGDEFDVGVSSPTMDEINLLFEPFTCGCQAVIDAMRVDLNAQLVGETITMPELALAQTKTAGCDITALQYATTLFATNKDSHADTIAGCALNTVHGAETLIQVAVAAKDGYIAFDLSNFPASSTVTAADLEMRIDNTAIVERSLTSFGIADASETWTEAAMRCDNRPAASGANKQTFVIPNTGGVGQLYLFNLAQAWLDRLTARMGTSSCTFLFQTSNTTQTNIRSKEFSAESAPRLSLVFTVPV